MVQDAGHAARERPALRLSRPYDNVAPEQVWQAWTDPQALSVWFGPGEANSVLIAETDLRVGGRFRVAFRMPHGQVHEVSGTYREVARPHRLVFTWAWHSTPERESLVSVELAVAGNGTRMDFLHEQFFDEAARDDHESGWLPAFDKLAAMLKTVELDIGALKPAYVAG